MTRRKQQKHCRKKFSITLENRSTSHFKTNKVKLIKSSVIISEHSWIVNENISKLVSREKSNVSYNKTSSRNSYCIFKLFKNKATLHLFSAMMMTGTSIVFNLKLIKFDLNWSHKTQLFISNRSSQLRISWSKILTQSSHIECVHCRTRFEKWNM